MILSFSDVELNKGMKRHTILREPTPVGVEMEDEDCASNLLKDRTTFAASQCNVHETLNLDDTEKCSFAQSLDLYPLDKERKSSE